MAETACKHLLNDSHTPCPHPVFLREGAWPPAVIIPAAPWSWLLGSQGLFSYILNQLGIEGWLLGFSKMEYQSVLTVSNLIFP